MWRGVAVAIVCSWVWLGGLGRAIAQDAPAELGTITGTVLDKGSSDPIIEAGVEVIGLKKTVRTDLDGRFSVKVPPGTYELRIFAPLFQGARLQNITVKANEVTRVNTSLAAAVAGVEVVEVVAQAKKAAEATQLLKRQKADVIEDNIGAETIRKTPDSDAAEVVERLAAVTVEDNKFLYVRGLGERYSSALLNGSRLASPDPEKRVVPLDLFPANFIDSMSIIKTFTPDLPGDFSGGLLDIDLRDYPDKLEASASLSTSANTATTFKRFRTYAGRGNSLPDIFPESSIQLPSIPDQRFYASSLPTVWEPENMIAPPDAGVTASVGNSWGPFGLSLAGVYSNEYQELRDQIVRSIVNSGTVENPDLQIPDDFKYENSTQSQRLGGVLTSAYKLADAHRLNFRALFNENTDKQVLIGKGIDAQSRNSVVTQFQRTTERLSFGQFAGQHNFKWVEADWRSGLSYTTQDIPDTRILNYADGAFSNEGNGGQRAFSTLDEYLTDSALDFTVPFKTWLPGTDVWTGLNAKLKLGGRYYYADRDYRLRIFKYTLENFGTRASQPPDELLNPVNIGNPGIGFQEISQARDRFHATQEIGAGYTMVDLPIVRDKRFVKDLRLVGGVRLQSSYIHLITADDQANQVQVRKNDLNPLPAVNLIYSPIATMNVRGAWSETLSYPEFRELTPALFPAPRGFRPLIGNVDLVQSKITSWDLRWEWFFSPNEVVSLGGFYKEIDQPIEVIVLQSASQLIDTFINADKAKLKGFEFEVRNDFAFIRPQLQYLTFGLNVAYVQSDVTVPRGETLEVQTSTSRALVGQAPFVINTVLDYTHPRWGTARILYGTAGTSIQEAGANGLPDIQQQRRDQLDAVLIFPFKETLGVPVSLKLSFENLLNDPYPTIQGDVTQERYTTGTKFGMSLTYTY